MGRWSSFIIIPHSIYSSAFVIIHYSSPSCIIIRPKNYFRPCSARGRAPTSFRHCWFKVPPAEHSQDQSVYGDPHGMPSHPLNPIHGTRGTLGSCMWCMDETRNLSHLQKENFTWVSSLSSCFICHQSTPIQRSEKAHIFTTCSPFKTDILCWDHDFCHQSNCWSSHFFF